VERISAILDTDIEEVKSEQTDIGVAGIDVVHDAGGGFARGSALFTIDEVGNLEIQGEVGFEEVGATCACDEALEL
jgi:hypothetical protein